VTLLDSNILIEATRPGSDALRAWLGGRVRFVSAISRLEVLGFHRIGEDERRDLEILLASTTEIDLSRAIIDRAVTLRQARKMTLGDALIAATALVNALPLATRNLKDFQQIDGLGLIDPPA
jgi:predicted nucleic acid-binding protein